MNKTSQTVKNTKVLTTGGVHRTASGQPELSRFVGTCLKRHLCGDWGDLDPNDTEANNQAVRGRDRLLSSYDLPEAIEVDTNFGPATADKVWIITDPGWATTTILWPAEY